MPTPVWIAADPADPDGRLLIWTNPAAGKVKRIRRNPAVTLAPCSMRGEVLGQAVPATVTLLPPTEVPALIRALIAKYGWQARMTFLPHKLAGLIGRERPSGVIEVHLDDPAGTAAEPAGE